MAKYCPKPKKKFQNQNPKKGKFNFKKFPKNSQRFQTVATLIDMLVHEEEEEEKEEKEDDDEQDFGKEVQSQDWRLQPLDWTQRNLKPHSI